MVHSAQLCDDASAAQHVGGRWASLIDFISGGDSRAPTPKDAFYSKLASVPQNSLPRETVVLRIRVTDALSGTGAAAVRTTDVTIGVTMLCLGPTLRHAFVAAGGDRTEEFRYIVHTRLGSGKARAMAVDAEHREMKLIPWGGVAALLSHATFRPSGGAAMITDASAPASAGVVSDGGAVSELCPEMAGRAFCFLPLPVETTLPVHVRVNLARF